MKRFQNILFIIMMGHFLYAQEIYTRGILYPVDASFCMDQCSEYMIEAEEGYTSVFVMDQDGYQHLDSYIMQEVEVWGEEYFCIECSAVDVSNINLLIDECMDLSDLDFGVCGMYLGWAWTGEDCQDFSGCGYTIYGIDYSESFYDSYDHVACA